MRAPVIGLWFANDRERREAFIRASTAVTHRDPRAVKAALIIGEAAAMAGSKTPELAAILNRLECHIVSDEMSSRFAKLREHLATRQSVRDYADSFSRRQVGEPKSQPGFWELKSKNPYLWSHLDGNGIPWIQFLGYQIRHDGQVRIRLQSLKKQCKKVTDVGDKFRQIINPGGKTKDGIPVCAPGLRMDPHAILHCFSLPPAALIGIKGSSNHAEARTPDRFRVEGSP